MLVALDLPGHPPLDIDQYRESMMIWKGKLNPGRHMRVIIDNQQRTLNNGPFEQDHPDSTVQVTGRKVEMRRRSDKTEYYSMSNTRYCLKPYANTTKALNWSNCDGPVQQAINACYIHNGTPFPTAINTRLGLLQFKFIKQYASSFI